MNPPSSLPTVNRSGSHGTFGDDYGLQREVEDMDAIIKKTSAYYVFGTATVAIIALQSALYLPVIRKVVLFEPPFYVNEDEMNNLDNIGKRYNQYVSQSNLSMAMVTSSEIATKVSGDELEPPYQWVKYIPNVILRLIFIIVMELDSRMIKEGDITLKDLVPTFHNDVVLVNETKGTIDNFKEVSADVLLINGSKTFLFLKHSIDALNDVLPHVEHIEVQGIDHAAAEDATGKPEIIAQEIKRFIKK